MERKSPLYVTGLQVCAYGFSDKNDTAFIDQYEYEKRHDYLVYPNDFSGIAVRIEFCHFRSGKGVRRKTSLSVIDIATQSEVASSRMKVNIGKEECSKFMYADFVSGSTGIIPDHAYKLVVCDEATSDVLWEEVIRLYSYESYLHPKDWYCVAGAGMRSSWEWDTYTSVRTIDYSDYLVRFRLRQNFKPQAPLAMPEVEIRIYYPEDKRVDTLLVKPERFGCEENSYFVESVFSTSSEENGVFYAELRCMQNPIAGFVFDTCKEGERGELAGSAIIPLDEYSPEKAKERLETPAAENAVDSREKAAGASLLRPLDHLTGLRSVKEKLSTYERLVRFNKMRADRGLQVSSLPLHAMFLGSPGTGKTTVAKLMGLMLRKAGVLSKGHVVVRDRATLLGQNYNSESEKTLAAIEEAKGGILFIDEAYQLYQHNDPRDPGKFVIETLLTALSDSCNRDWMLILAGYPDEMKRMFEMNPGFKSRIPDSNIYVFDDFTESELMEIAEKYLEGCQYSLSHEAHEALAQRLRTDYSQRGKNFGNARHVVNVIQTEILPAMAVRVTTQGLADEQSLTEIQASDIPLPSYSAAPRPRVGFAY